METHRETLFFDFFTQVGRTPGMHPAEPESLEALRAELRHCSIAGAVVASARRYDLDYENRSVSERLQGDPRLVPAWTLQPSWGGPARSVDAMIHELERQRVRVVALRPKTDLWSLHSVAHDEFFHALARAKVPLVLDAQEECSLAEIETLAGRFRELVVVARNVHWSQLRVVHAMLTHCATFHLALDAFQPNRGLEFLVREGFEDRLLYSSNAPRKSAGAARAYVDWADIPDSAREKIAAGNALRLLRLPSPAPADPPEADDALMQAARRGAALPCPVCDLHAHMLHEGLHSGGGISMIDGGPRGVRELNERLGVTSVAIMSWSGIQTLDADEGNDCVAAAIEAAPDFYRGLATFDVGRDSPEELERKLQTVFSDPRFVGIKPYPTFGLSYADPRYAPLWRFAEDRGLYVGVHPFHWYKPDEFEHLCANYPRLRVVAYHAGCSYEVADTLAQLMRRYRNLYAEINYSSICGGIIDYLVAKCGVDRVIYGSDQPMRDPRPQLGWVVFSRLSAESKRRVLGANATTFLARPEVARR